MAAESFSNDRDWAVAPGEILLEALEERGMSQSELARRMGRPIKTINEIVKGKAAITPDTALQLELTLGISAGFWNGLEAMYREHLARERSNQQLETEGDWLDAFPLSDLARYGLINRESTKGATLAALLAFFGVGSTVAWEDQWLKPDVAFRASGAFESSPHAVAAWLRWGEVMAADITTKPFDAERLKNALQDVRPLTRREPMSLIITRVKDLLAETGIALVVAPELAGTRLSGAVHWPSSDQAIIQLSFRHKTDDHFWFSLFHEAGHVLDRTGRNFIDEIDEEGSDEQDEQNANEFARNALISREVYASFIRKAIFDSAAVRAFAREQQIAPGIVVGRLQRDGLLPKSHLNDLKKSIQWASPLA
jgi:HTH-type transcriptional regulator / antitoxin HigA